MVDGIYDLLIMSTLVSSRSIPNHSPTHLADFDNAANRFRR